MVELLWLVIGLAIGILAAWLFLAARNRANLGAQEVRLSETNRRIQRALERELSAHEGTKQRLARMSEEDEINKARMEELGADLDASRRVLESVQTDTVEKSLEITRLNERVQELIDERDAARNEVKTFDKVVARARVQSDAMTQGIMAKLATLESRLKGMGTIEEASMPEPAQGETPPKESLVREGAKASIGS